MKYKSIIQVGPTEELGVILNQSNTLHVYAGSGENGFQHYIPEVTEVLSQFFFNKKLTVTCKTILTNEASGITKEAVWIFTTKEVFGGAQLEIQSMVISEAMSKVAVVELLENLVPDKNVKSHEFHHIATELRRYGCSAVIEHFDAIFHEWNASKLSEETAVKYHEQQPEILVTNNDGVTYRIEVTPLCSDTNATWEQAQSYCRNCTIGGNSDWVIPNIDELYVLYDKYKEGWRDFKAQEYWSITDTGLPKDTVLTMDFEEGRSCRVNISPEEQKLRRIRLIRRIPLTQEQLRRLETNDSDNSIDDDLEIIDDESHVTELEGLLCDNDGDYYKLIVAPIDTEIETSLDGALKYCKKLHVDTSSYRYRGTGWRLPDVDELKHMHGRLSNDDIGYWSYWSCSEAPVDQDPNNFGVIVTVIGIDSTIKVVNKASKYAVRAVMRDYEGATEQLRDNMKR